MESEDSEGRNYVDIYVGYLSNYSDYGHIYP